MSFLNSLNITGSALTAQRFRTDIILQNIANQNTTRTENGGPYRRKQVVLKEQGMNFESELNHAITNAQKGGVIAQEVIEDESDLIPVYDPKHPDANEQGYVMMPNVNSAEEMVDLMAATRAYEANITALNIGKAMAMKALEIGK